MVPRAPPQIDTTSAAEAAVITEHNKIVETLFTIEGIWSTIYSLGRGDTTTSPSTTVQNGNAHYQGICVEFQKIRGIIEAEKLKL
jgi:hypothetical protein